MRTQVLIGFCAILAIVTRQSYKYKYASGVVKQFCFPRRAMAVTACDERFTYK